jgi:hypothetical protein
MTTKRHPWCNLLTNRIIANSHAQVAGIVATGGQAADAAIDSRFLARSRRLPAEANPVDKCKSHSPSGLPKVISPVGKPASVTP